MTPANKGIFSETKISFFIWVVAFLLIPSFASASTVFETTDTVRWIGIFRYSFDADIDPYTYQVTLSDLSVEPDEGL